MTAGLAALALLVTLAWWGRTDLSSLLPDARAFHGEPWRLVTDCLPHVNLLHLAFNLYWLWVFGTLVEGVFGHARAGALFLFLAAGSSAAAGACGEDGVGLSGVGYGLFALLWVLGRYYRRFREAVDEQTTSLFVGWFFLCLLLTHAGLMRVGNIAHGAGAALGALVGLAVAERRHRPLLAALTACVFLSALGAGFLLRPAGVKEGRPMEDLAAPGGVEAPQAAAEEEIGPVPVLGDGDVRGPAAARLLSLRQAAQAWLARAVPAKTRAANRAYADLTFAFALARLGEGPASRELLHSADGSSGVGTRSTAACWPPTAIASSRRWQAGRTRALCPTRCSRRWLTSAAGRPGDCPATWWTGCGSGRGSSSRSSRSTRSRRGRASPTVWARN
jgi:membrane associated rhomboid family serine protease